MLSSHTSTKLYSYSLNVIFKRNYIDRRILSSQATLNRVFSCRTLISPVRQQKQLNATEKTYQTSMSYTPAPHRCEKALAMVVCRRKLQFDPRPWCKQYNSRLLRHRLGFNLATLDSQTWSRPSSFYYPEPWPPPPPCHLPPTLVPVHGCSLQYVHDNGC